MCAYVRVCVCVLGQQELCLQLFKVHIMDSKSVAVNLQPLVPRKSRLAEVKVSQGRCWCWTHTRAHVHQPAELVPSASVGTQSRAGSEVLMLKLQLLAERSHDGC